MNRSSKVQGAQTCASPKSSGSRDDPLDCEGSDLVAGNRVSCAFQCRPPLYDVTFEVHRSDWTANHSRANDAFVRYGHRQLVEAERCQAVLAYVASLAK